jgi:hypothetical protein
MLTHDHRMNRVDPDDVVKVGHPFVGQFVRGDIRDERIR